MVQVTPAPVIDGSNLLCMGFYDDPDGPYLLAWRFIHGDLAYNQLVDGW